MQGTNKQALIGQTYTTHYLAELTILMKSDMNSYTGSTRNERKGQDTLLNA